MARVIRKVVDDLYLLRMDDRETRFFEAMWEIPEGVTYNAYLLAGEEAVLFDTWKAVYSEEFVEALREIIDLKDLKYLVVHHAEPDHSGCIPRLLEENPKLTVLGTPLALRLVRSLYQVEARFKPLRDSEVMEVGGHTLTFFATPWLHWPDTMMTYVKDLKVLLTCDAFGAFSTPPQVFDDEGVPEEYWRYAKKYLVGIVGRYREWILKNLDKLGKLGLEIEVVAPAHGIVFRKSPLRIIEFYRRVAAGEPDPSKAVIVYASMYGAVEEAVKIVEEELVKAGYTVAVFGFNDKSRSSFGEVLAELPEASVLVVGASTYDGGAFPLIKYLLDLITAKASYGGRKAIVVASYGWKGVAGREIAGKLENAGFNVIDVIEFEGKADRSFKQKLEAALSSLKNVPER